MKKENVDVAYISCRYWSQCTHGYSCLQSKGYAGGNRFFPEIYLNYREGKKYQINCNDFEEIKK